MLKLSSWLRNPFSFLFAKTSVEEQVVAYLTREHARGRRVSEILQDRYVQNRLTPQQQARQSADAWLLRPVSSLSQLAILHIDISG